MRERVCECDCECASVCAGVCAACERAHVHSRTHSHAQTHTTTAATAAAAAATQQQQKLQQYQQHQQHQQPQPITAQTQPTVKLFISETLFHDRLAIIECTLSVNDVGGCVGLVWCESGCVLYESAVSTCYMCAVCMHQWMSAHSQGVRCVVRSV